MASPPASTVKKASPGIPRQIKYIDMEAVWDVKILCGDIEFRAHKAFLCRESDFFLKALAGNFMEAQKDVVTLSEEQPDLLEQMLRYVYIRNYQCLDPPEGMKKLIFDAKLYALADKYQMESLRCDIVSVFKNDIHGQWEQAVFPNIVNEVYSSTPDSDRQLRDPVVLEMAAHFHELSKDTAVLACLKNQPGFAVDLVDALHKVALENKRRYGCTKCGTIFEAVIPLSKSGVHLCPICKQSLPAVEWLHHELQKEDVWLPGTFGSHFGKPRGN